jgi:hypothetical protein
MPLMNVAAGCANRPREVKAPTRRSTRESHCHIAHDAKRLFT